MMPIRQPPAIPAAGTVMTQPRKIQPNARQLIALARLIQREGAKVSWDSRPPDTSPTPAVDPVMHIVVETGIPSIIVSRRQHLFLLSSTHTVRLARR